MVEKTKHSGTRDGLLVNNRHIQQIEWVDPTSLAVLGQNPRSHPAKQRRALRNSISRLGFLVPILIDGRNRIIAGHARAQAAIELGMSEIPAIRVSHLSDAEIRAFRIADNRLAELGEWDRDVLAIEFRYLVDIDFHIETTGFDTPEIDIVLEGTRPTPKPVDMVADAILDCTRPGDIVLDPFLGGGTTLIACERTDRRCRAIEIDPLYVDTAIRRWEALTGGVAICTRTGRTFADMAAERDAPKALPAPDDVEDRA
jgi:hypothetical protein